MYYYNQSSVNLTRNYLERSMLSLSFAILCLFHCLIYFSFWIFLLVNTFYIYFLAVFITILLLQLSKKLNYIVCPYSFTQPFICSLIQQTLVQSSTCHAQIQHQNYKNQDRDYFPQWDGLMRVLKGCISKINPTQKDYVLQHRIFRNIYL